MDSDLSYKEKYYALLGTIRRSGVYGILVKSIENADTVDVVKCKDCIHFKDEDCELLESAGNVTLGTDENDYCSMAKRKDDEE